MRPAHAGFRVAWRFAHARNLAFMALRQGYSETAIVSAWSAAIARSHEDACDHDLRQRPDPNNPHPLREPSAAVAYAWKLLRADQRSPEERWREIYSTPRQPRGAGPTSKGATHKSGPGSGSGAGKVAGVSAGKAGQRRSIESALKARGMKLQDLLKMSRADQGKFVREAFAAQKKGFDEKDNLSV